MNKTGDINLKADRALTLQQYSLIYNSGRKNISGEQENTCQLFLHMFQVKKKKNRDQKLADLRWKFPHILRSKNLISNILFLFWDRNI